MIHREYLDRVQQDIDRTKRCGSRSVCRRWGTRIGKYLIMPLKQPSEMAPRVKIALSRICHCCPSPNRSWTTGKSQGSKSSPYSVERMSRPAAELFLTVHSEVSPAASPSSSSTRELIGAPSDMFLLRGLWNRGRTSSTRSGTVQSSSESNTSGSPSLYTMFFKRTRMICCRYSCKRLFAPGLSGYVDQNSHASSANSSLLEFDVSIM
mmetsp:Transcript_11291/g.34559  ORF Transcript_11291/g.34559 Transcript_11291/m.34559 type:complete len:208 (+) Transcript_11291:1312-1935(+)